MRVFNAVKNAATKSWEVVENNANKAMVAAGGFLASGAAMAQGGPDLSSITGEIDQYKTAVVALVIAFAVVLWAIKAAGLAKPR